MSRNRARRRSGLELLHRVKHHHRKDFDTWQNQFATRRDVAEIIETYLDSYDRQVTERWWARAKINLRMLWAIVANQARRVLRALKFWQRTPTEEAP